MLLLIIALITFAAIFLFAFAFASPREDVVARRIGARGGPPSARERSLEGGLGKRMFGPAFHRAGELASRLLPQNMVRSVEHMLVMANEPWSLPGFLAFWVLFSAGGVGFYIYLGAIGNLSVLQYLTLGLLIIPLALLAPYAILRRRVKKRQASIIRGLPDAMDLLVTCVEAGMGVDAAFATVAERTEGPLSETFALYLRQVGLGRARREALHHIGERTGVDDLKEMATSVNQGEELGTMIGDVLRTQAEDLRAARRQRAQEAAQRAPVLMTIPLVLCFIPAMAAVVIVPSILNMLRFVGDIGTP